MKTLEELGKMKDAAFNKLTMNDGQYKFRVVVGMATCGIAAGAKPVMDTILEELKNRNISNVEVINTGCIGVCRLEPIVEVYSPNGDRVTYVDMTPDKATKIVEEHLINGTPCFEYTIAATENNGTV